MLLTFLNQNKPQEAFMSNVSEKLDGMTVADARARRDALCTELNGLIAEKVAAFEAETGVRVRDNDLVVNVNHAQDKVIVTTGFRIII
jgi:hypothetical protein